MRGFQHKSKHFFFKVLCGFVGGSSLGVGLLATYLSFFPLPLSFLIPFILDSISTPYTFSAKRLALVWRTWSSPWELQVDDFKTHFETPTQLEIIQIPRLYLTPRWLECLRGKLALKAVAFSSPTWLSEGKEPSFGGLEQVQKIAHFLFESPSQDLLKKLPTHIILENPISHIWPFLRLNFQRSSHILKLELSDSQGFSGLCTLTYHPDSRTLDITAQAQHFSLAHLLSRNGTQTSLLQKMPRLSGSFNTQLSLDTPIYTGEFALEGTDQRADAIQKLLLTGTWDEKGLILKSGTLSQENVQFTCNGALQKAADPSDHMRLSFKAQTQGIPVAQLERLWPTDLASFARAWILENISEGEIGESVLEMTGLLDENHSLAKGSVKGQLTLNNLVISFLKGMPAVRHVSGTAHFTDKGFDIQLTKGTLKDQILQKGHILIEGLDLPDQTFSSQLILKGSIPSLFDILSYPPLEYTQKIDLPLETLRGEIETVLDITFPLERDIEFSAVDLKAKSRLHQVVYDFQFKKGAKPLQFDQGELALSVTPEKLELSGKARLQKEPVTLQWKENFKKPETRQLILQLRLNPFILDYWGVPVKDTVRGTFPFQLTYEPRAKTPLRFEADLTRAHLNFDFLNWVKKPGQRALLTGRLQQPPPNSKDQLSFIKDLSFESPGVTLKGELSLTPTHDIQHLTFSQIRAPRFDCSFSAQKNQKEWLLSLKGPSADIGGFLNSSPSSSSSPPSHSQKMHITFDLHHLYAGADTCFYGLKGIIDGVTESTGFNPTSCMLTARSSQQLSPDVEKARAESITISLHPLANGHQKFSLEAGNAGYFFNTLGWMQNIRKGSLLVEATQKIPLQPFEGKIILEDFTVTKTPFLTQLFMTLASPTSFLNLFSGGEINFSRFESKASWQNGVLRFRRAIFQNINTGISFRGSINTNTRKLNLRGNLIPAYMINRILNSIPGLREILTGGKDNGIGATSFKVSGPLSEPVLEVNPMSALTPPFLKGLFSALEEDETTVERDEKVMRK